MSNTSEEDYLNQLLNSVNDADSEPADEHIVRPVVDVPEESGKVLISDLDDPDADSALLSQMLMADNGIIDEPDTSGGDSEEEESLTLANEDNSFVDDVEDTLEIPTGTEENIIDDAGKNIDDIPENEDMDFLQSMLFGEDDSSDLDDSDDSSDLVEPDDAGEVNEADTSSVGSFNYEFEDDPQSGEDGGDVDNELLSSLQEIVDDTEASNMGDAIGDDISDGAIGADETGGVDGADSADGDADDDISIEDLIANEIGDQGGKPFVLDDSLRDLLGESGGDGIDFISHDETAKSEDNSEAFNDELADILALDDSESLDDIPEESTGSISEEEMDLLGEIESNHDADKAAEAEAAAKEEKEKKKKEKKEKKKKKKDKKGEALGEVLEDEPGPKGILGFFKRFFTEDDEEDSEVKKAADENQQLIDELYEGKESLDGEGVDDGKGKKGKKEKKPKEKKEKKVKEKKPKKEKPPKEEDNSPKIKLTGIGVFLLIGILLIVGATVGGNIFNKQTALSQSRAAYADGDYTSAYSRITGLKLSGDDLKYYNGLKCIMRVQEGIVSYKNYMKPSNYDVIKALDSLIIAVALKNTYSAEADQYGVTEKVDVVYRNVLYILSQYGIDEETALELNEMNSRKAYEKALAEYGGVTVDSDN